jgi:aconitase A
MVTTDDIIIGQITEMVTTEDIIGQITEMVTTEAVLSVRLRRW